MLATLTESRLSLASTAQTNLSKLITQLEGMVSEIPAGAQHRQEEKDEDEESNEDPTELFHRDIGVQTSPLHSEAGSRPSTPTPDSVLTEQTSRLKSLKETLSELIEDSTSEGHDVVELEATIGVLKEYLDGMAYVTPTYNFGVVGGVGGYGAGRDGGKEADDEISRVKAGIKSMKGALLSARSFPGGGRGVGAR
jgi:hypothetical protein